jgi:hypothetical protein
MCNLSTATDDSAIEWQDIPGYEGHYQASNTGLIRTIKKTKYKKPGDLIPQHLNKANGYKSVHFGNDNRTLYVHRLVMAAFAGEPPAGMHVNHINGIKTDNRRCNLEYVTPKENIEHSIKVLDKRGGAFGVAHRDAKLNPEKVILIRQMLADGKKSARDWQSVRCLISGYPANQTWSNLEAR